MPIEPTVHSTRRQALLWALAALIMLGSVVFQRLTGPTHPKRGSFRVGETTYRYRLSRSGDSSHDERIALPDPGQPVQGWLSYRRFRTADAWTSIPLGRETRDGRQELAARLPRQPAAGKLEYVLALGGGSQQVRIPADNHPIIIRFKDPVPAPLLASHVILMFFGVMLGVRAGLAGLVHGHDMRRLAWATLSCLTVGGLVLGPFVQKYAFGAFWTGFPFGGDLTDNKTLIMWGAWALACGLLTATKHHAPRRLALGLAAAVMLTVYLIPHSARGSELDYSKLERGVDPTQAVTTGR